MPTKREYYLLSGSHSIFIFPRVSNLSITQLPQSQFCRRKECLIRGSMAPLRSLKYTYQNGNTVNHLSLMTPGWHFNVGRHFRNHRFRGLWLWGRTKGRQLPSVSWAPPGSVSSKPGTCRTLRMRGRFLGMSLVLLLTIDRFLDRTLPPSQQNLDRRIHLEGLFLISH